MAVDGQRAGRVGGLAFLRRLFAERKGRAAAPVDDPLGEAVLLALRRHGIAPTPEAFTLWYRHLAGERPDLTRRILYLEARGERFDAALVGTLHERYFGAGHVALQVAGASREAARLLARLAEDLAAAEADAAARAARLEEVGAAFETPPDALAAPPPAPVHDRYGEMRALVERLAQETREMRLAAGRLQHRVVEGAAEIGLLRKALAAAGTADEIDPVSGVARRRLLDRALARAAAAAGADRPLTFLVVDLDRFAAFNGTCGRHLGDLMLEATARRIARELKPEDTIGRLEGAAFGVVLVATDLEEGAALAERLCRAIGGLRLATGEAEDAIPPVTVSIGVARWHPGEPLQRLVGRADRACREAARAGGDRALSERAITILGRPKA